MKKRVWVFGLMICLAAFSFSQDRQQSATASQFRPEESAGGAPLIMGYAEAPPGIDKTEMELGRYSVNYPTNTSLGYKGVVMANLHGDEPADEIAADFGSLGLWVYDNDTWYQLSGVNPEAFISCTWGSTTDDELIVDFGSIGLWRWDYSGYPGSWVQFSGVNPAGMFAADDDDDGLSEIHVDFGTLGVWRLDDDGPWTQLSGLDPYCGLKMDAGALGYHEGVWCFPSVGVWNIFWASGPVYKQLTGTVTSQPDHASAQFTNTSGAEDLVMDFASLGLWLYEESWGPWYQISSMSVNRVKEVKFVGNQDYELLAEDNVGGLYWGNWSSTTKTFDWTLISNNDIGPGEAWCETFDKDGTDSGDEEVIIPWTSGGASIFDYSAGSTLSLFFNTDYFVKFIVKGDYFGRGYDSTVVTAFTTSSPNSGLFLYEPKTSTTRWISDYVPDGSY